MLAPYSEIATSKLSSAAGTASALPCQSGNSGPNSCWKARAERNCSAELSMPDGPGPAPREPRGHIRGPTASSIASSPTRFAGNTSAPYPAPTRSPRRLGLPRVPAHLNVLSRQRVPRLAVTANVLRKLPRRRIDISPHAHDAIRMGRAQAVPPQVVSGRGRGSPVARMGGPRGCRAGSHTRL